MKDKQEKTKRGPLRYPPTQGAEWLAERKRRREINRKRDEEQAQWDAQFNAPLNWKDRD